MTNPETQFVIDLSTRLHGITAAMRAEARRAMRTDLVETHGLTAPWTVGDHPLWQYADQLDALLGTPDVVTP